MNSTQSKEWEKTLNLLEKELGDTTQNTQVSATPSELSKKREELSQVKSLEKLVREDSVVSGEDFVKAEKKFAPVIVTKPTDVDLYKPDWPNREINVRNALEGRTGSNCYYKFK